MKFYGDILKIEKESHKKDMQIISYDHHNKAVLKYD